VGYNESSKAYRIYIPHQRQIDVSRDVIFEEEIAFRRSRESQMEIDNEPILSSPSAVQRETVIDTADPVDPVAPVDAPRDIAIGHKRHAWAQRTLQEAEGHATPRGTFQESKRPQRFSSYVSAMSHIIDIEPSCHGEAVGQQVWQDAMTEEYQSIMKNDVWDIVPRP
jgi:cell division septation protein DedD